MCKMRYDVKTARLRVNRQNCLALIKEQKVENAELASVWQIE